MLTAVTKICTQKKLLRPEQDFQPIELKEMIEVAEV